MHGALGGIVKAGGLGDGSWELGNDHRQAALDAATQTPHLTRAKTLVADRVMLKTEWSSRAGSRRGGRASYRLRKKGLQASLPTAPKDETVFLGLQPQRDLSCIEKGSGGVPCLCRAWRRVQRLHQPCLARKRETWDLTWTVYSITRASRPRSCVVSVR